MADPEILTEFPPSKKGRNPIHDKYLDGLIRRLVKGEHYTCKTSSMVTTFYERAKKLGVKVRIQVDGDTMVVQAFGEGVE